MKLKLLLLTFLLPLASLAQPLQLLGRLGYNGSCAGVWHYVDSLNNEYAIIGVANRVSIADVTNPASPVEVFSVPALPGQNSLWREVKTHKKHAYSVSEGGGGVIIIDLTYLPDSISYSHWYGDSIIAGQLQSAHTLAATDGYLYIFGSNINTGGCIIADLADPANPHFTGQYELNYVHDGYIRNDTLWAGEIYQGQFSVIDVSDKSNPVLLQTQQTPGQFCHNIWLSDDSKYAFTTDEVGGAPLGSFDVTDINNISLETVYFTDSMPAQEVHNVRVLDDFLINPSYGSQITLVDAARPQNLIEIGRAPTDFNTGGNFLCWDASPYLPSGNIIATDVAGGLLIFQPQYLRACYLEGTVTDSLTGMPVNNALVEILSTGKSALTDFNGIYKTGIADSGTYDIRVSAQGYISKTYASTSLSNGVLTQIDAELVPFFLTGSVTDSTLIPLPGIAVTASNGTNSYSTTTDSSGEFLLTNLEFGSYTVSAGAWGYQTSCITSVADATPVQLILTPGYMDDFSTDNGWQVTGNATTGIWERGIPVGTFYAGQPANPGMDVSGDCSDFCYVTGNGGGNATTDDVDNGNTVLTSPVFDLTSYSNPHVHYSRWFFIVNNVAPGSADSLFIYIENGTTDALLESADLNTPDNATWVSKSHRISDFVVPGPSMRLRIEISDFAPGFNILEAGFDDFRVSDEPLSVKEIRHANLHVYPNPFTHSFKLQADDASIAESAIIRIEDLSGRTVFISGWNEIIDPGRLPAGVYMLHIENTDVPVKPAKLVRN